MRYHVFATDFDGTLASQNTVPSSTIEKLRLLKTTGRRLILVTGREMEHLIADFPAYTIFDDIIAENGALLYHVSDGGEKLLGPPADASFVKLLKEKGVAPISVGKVIVATWEPHELEVLEAIKSSAIERQVIFNKGAVMILPPGINKASGLQTLLKSLCLSLHNTVAIGDAENDSALLQVTECSIAVENALPSLKTAADLVTDAGHGKGVEELIDRLIRNDLSDLDEKLIRHYLKLGTRKDGSPFMISPYRSGMLISGVSGCGKTTFAVSIAECLNRQGYQFCLIDPEGDYLEMPGALVIGQNQSRPTIEEIKDLLMNPDQNLVICTLSIPLVDRPAFFSGFLPVFTALRQKYGHPHWLLLDEAHHLIPEYASLTNQVPSDFNNFILISTSPHLLHPAMLSRAGMMITLGSNPAYSMKQVAAKLQLPAPADMRSLAEDEICVWEYNGTPSTPFIARYHVPQRLLQRHKRKYAQGDMGWNSFIFTGPEAKLHLVANNLMMFKHIAAGIDTDTWLFHLHRHDFTRWFSDSLHDEELAGISKEVEKIADPHTSRHKLLSFIADKYTV